MNSGERGLWQDRSFWGHLSTQFLGAFNDNLFKQLILLLAISEVTSGNLQASEKQDVDIQSIAMVIFAVPFILLAGIAGFLSERFSKQRIFVWSKVAEIVVMLLGVLAFILLNREALKDASASELIRTLIPLFIVLFFMGAQSSFFGPSKLGILPELFQSQDLPKVNGMVVMTTFLSIILGMGVAGVILDGFGNKLWGPGMVCVGIAVFGTGTALLIRRVPVANAQLKFKPSSLGVAPEVRQNFGRDRTLLWAMIISCLFWGGGALVQMSINSVGKQQLLIGHGNANTWTSLLAASIAIGIAIGSLLSGFLSGGRINVRLLRYGCCGIVLFMFLLSIPGSRDNHLLGYWGCFAAMLLLGAATGLFYVPLQTFLQARPLDNIKGRILATTAMANWIAILLCALLYSVFDRIIKTNEWPRSILFAFTALLFLPIALCYHPDEKEMNRTQSESTEPTSI
jgi:acyl-[acyl-carrier-protein]-phospholipid O-acyltransferase/long-chain-fatty-acid--[acyl-carrier-protein] ligase